MERLLATDEPGPVTIMAGGTPPSPFLILCDHAGRRIPRKLADLGLGEADLARHIAWDIGVDGTARYLGPLLGATVISQVYSRLVIDCNRTPFHPSSIPTISERTPIPGNMALAEAEIRARQDEILHPYHRAIEAEIERRLADAQETIVIALHSFTPVYMDVARPWHAGVLHDRNPGFALALGQALREATGQPIGDNEPYRLTDASDYTVPHHAEARGLPYVELEIRQDLIAEDEGQRRWAELLAQLLPQARTALR